MFSVMQVMFDPSRVLGRCEQQENCLATPMRSSADPMEARDLDALIGPSLCKADSKLELFLGVGGAIGSAGEACDGSSSF